MAVFESGPANADCTAGVIVALSFYLCPWFFRREIMPGVDYIHFLIPGLIMMTVLQNAFANTSSSLIQSKVTGNIVFYCCRPFPHGGMP